MSEPAPTPAPTRRGAPAACWGIDPGARAGAAVLVSVDVGERVGPGDVTVLAAVAWRHRPADRLYMLTDRDGGVRPFRTLHDVGRWIARTQPYTSALGFRVSLEGLFVGHDNPQSALTLAEAAGVVLGPFLSLDPNPLRPHPSTWRAKMLGSASLSAKAAAARAIQVAEHLAPGQLGALAGNDHAADALCIAVWGAVESSQPRTIA